MPSLGDAIYCRPFVKAFATTVETRWPDLYPDVGRAAGADIRPRYDTKNLALLNIPRAIGRVFPPLENVRPDLPVFSAPKGRYAVTRPPTLRTRFWAPARNPRADYVRQAAAMLRDMEFTTVGVGNIGTDECFDGDPPCVDEPRWQGMPVPHLMGLLSGAALIVAGPGYTVPAAIAYDVPHVIVYGGAAKWNAPDKMTDPFMGRIRLTAVEPDRFCWACRTVRHACNKTITQFEDKFADAVDRALSM